VVRSAQKGRDDIQRIQDAMEGRKPVIADYQRELIVKQANIIGEDGLAMIQDIEDAALNTTTKLLPADVFKMIESCMASLSQKARVQMQSDEVTRQKEPERLKQIEAIREQATMLHGSRLNKDKLTEESVVKTMRDAVIKYYYYYSNFLLPFSLCTNTWQPWIRTKKTGWTRTRPDCGRSKYRRS
jgi:hypothetical protein